MNPRAKNLVVVAGLLVVAAFATCYFGVRHDIARIPEKQRLGMSDFDWVGTVWVVRGEALASIAVALCVVAGILQWRHGAKPVSLGPLGG